ncbi:hypothetical protein VNO78_02950 [Psophocarpus tetragonolobus]|uniref:Uncharacterized protein n=1 Tax=Psophocarpus tetragonolobus TaxID=3891 RepID=A0AAN9SZR8_PSOTE
MRRLRRTLEGIKKALTNIFDKVVEGTNGQKNQPCLDLDMVSDSDHPMSPKKRGCIPASKLQQITNGSSEFQGLPTVSLGLDVVINTLPSSCTPPHLHFQAGNQSHRQCSGLLGEGLHQGRSNNNHDSGCFGMIIQLVGVQQPICNKATTPLPTSELMAIRGSIVVESSTTSNWSVLGM